MATTFHIRDAAPSPSNTDAHFITAAFDSCIPHLSTIGSATQWGTTPLSAARPGFTTRYITSIAEAEKSRLASYQPDSGVPVVRVLIAEAALPDGAGSIPVGAATLRAGYLPKYVLDQKHLEGVTKKLMAGEEGPFMFLEVLVTDFSEATKPYRKGAGAALVEYAREWVRGLGMGAMYVDCWAGNEGKLVRYVLSWCVG
jgi:GNAT superfamily N-acetyltransferase